MPERRIKVLHLITGLQSGGAERMLSQLVRQGKDASVEHLVVSMMGKGFFGQEIEDAGIRLYSLKMLRGVPSLLGFWRLIRILREERPEILQTWLYHADLMGIVAGKLVGVKNIVWNIRCSNIDLKRYSPLTRAVVWLLVRLSKYSTAVLVNSEVGYIYHLGLGYEPPRWEIIANGFDIEHFRPDEVRRRRFRRYLGVRDEELLAGMVARLDPQKDHATFLDALVELSFSGVGLTTVMVGRGCERGGPLSDAIHSRGLDDVVVLYGEAESVAEILPGMDLLVLSSAYGEGFPNVVGEAMAAGVPVVATDVGDVQKIADGLGWIVPPQNPQALAKALDAAIQMGQERLREMGALGRGKIREKSEINEIIARFNRFYRELSGGSE